MRAKYRLFIDEESVDELSRFLENNPKGNMPYKKAYFGIWDMLNEYRRKHKEDYLFKWGDLIYLVKWADKNEEYRISVYKKRGSSVSAALVLPSYIGDAIRIFLGDKYSEITLPIDTNLNIHSLYQSCADLLGKEVLVEHEGAYYTLSEKDKKLQIKLNGANKA